MSHATCKRRGEPLSRYRIQTTTSARIPAMRAVAFLLALAVQSGAAQPAATGCPAAQHRQFDFWVGTWEVIRPNGQRAGTNRIEGILGGCALYESWEGASGSRGHSLSAWDPGDNKWHQTWVDNEGTVLMISGGLVNGEMIMEGERRLPDGSQTLERITWTPNADSTVRQFWQSSRDRGMRWTTVFDGTYRKRSPRSELGRPERSSRR